MFELPTTYFVELIKSENTNFYYARYNDLYGYVLKNSVKPVKSTPITPFLTNISFRVFVPSGANLRSTPYNSGALNLIYSVPFLDNNLLYYGIMQGEESISKKGNIWYYCKYFSNNMSYEGYLYSPLCDLLSPISNNTEVVEYIEGDVFFDDNITQTVTPLDKMSSPAQTIIIIAISLPCLLFIYLLFKPTKIAESNSSSIKHKKNTSKKKISKLKHSDYYEFDDEY